jgi:hypothetical protein
MTSHMSATIAASLIADNVVPTTNVVPAASFGQGGQRSATLLGVDPKRVDMHAAVGGFNSVVQFSAPLCLRVFASDLALDTLSVPISPLKLRPFLNSQPGLTSVYLVSLKANFPTLFNVFPTIFVRFVPQNLQFIDENKVAVTYEATAGIEGPAVKIPFIPPAGFGGDSVIPSPRSNSSSGPEAEGITKGFLGTFTLTLLATYSPVIDASRGRVEILCDLTTAELQLSIPASDFKLLYDNGFLGNDGFYLKDYVLGKPKVHLTPTVSLFGTSNVNAPLKEFPSFSVSIFPIRFPIHLPVLAFAFSLLTGCEGFVEEVQQFIGEQDYGVISDEFLVQHLFHHQWNRGGFGRTLSLSQTTKVVRSGRKEDAQLVGTLRLDSLSIVSIEADSNTRTDYIKIGGAAEAIPEFIVLNDGTRLGPDQVKFGDPKQATWSLLTSIDIHPQLSADPQVRDFEMRAYLDAFRHIGRPFAWYPDLTAIRMIYTRIDAVTKQVYLLGNIPQVFI